jgi:hypothetical protein
LAWRKSYGREKAIESLIEAIRQIDSDCMKKIKNK